MLLIFRGHIAHSEVLAWRPQIAKQALLFLGCLSCFAGFTSFTVFSLGAESFVSLSK